MILLTAASDRVSSQILVNCFKKAVFSPSCQLQSESDDTDPLKILTDNLDEPRDKCEAPVDFTIEDYCDADEDVTTSEVHALFDQVIQSAY